MNEVSLLKEITLPVRLRPVLSMNVIESPTENEWESYKST